MVPVGKLLHWNSILFESKRLNTNVIFVTFPLPLPQECKYGCLVFIVLENLNIIHFFIVEESDFFYFGSFKQESQQITLHPIWTDCKHLLSHPQYLSNTNLKNPGLFQMVDNDQWIRMVLLIHWFYVYRTKDSYAKQPLKPMPLNSVSLLIPYSSIYIL